MKYLISLLTIIFISGNLFSQEPAIKKDVVRTDNAIVFDFDNFRLNSSLNIGYKRWVSPSIALKGLINCALSNSVEKINGTARENTLDQLGVSVFVEKHLRTYKKISFYLLGGVGTRYTKQKMGSINKQYGVSAEAGIGFECFLLDNISFSAQVSAYGSYSNEKNQYDDERKNTDRTYKTFGNKTSSLLLSIYF